MYQALLFDLDGTLTASGEGITKSIQYALRKMGYESLAEDLKKLEVFVGPPLLEQLMEYCQIEESEAEQGVAYYRERYNVVGYYENKPYKGIRKLLPKLKKKGYKLAVASSKPQGMVDAVLEHFELNEYFDVIEGSDVNLPRMTKSDVIEIALKKLGFFEAEKRKGVVMIGDRKYDVAGATASRLDCIGVAYGYGGTEELESAGAIKVVQTVEELGEFLGVSKKARFHDIGKELFSTLVYPGDPAPSKTPFYEIKKGDDCNLTILSFGSHNGTHLDAPKHFCEGKHGVDQIPLEKCLGECKVIKAEGVIGKEEMEALLADGTKKLLIKGEILLTPESAKVCAEVGLDLIGVESQTVGGKGTQKAVHQTLLSAEIVILEGLVLGEVTQGTYFLSALPMKMEGLDGSPVRPVLIEY